MRCYWITAGSGWLVLSPKRTTICSIYSICSDLLLTNIILSDMQLEATVICIKHLVRVNDLGDNGSDTC
jgi:hypothetical protein